MWPNNFSNFGQGDKKSGPVARKSKGMKKSVKLAVSVQIREEEKNAMWPAVVL